MITLDLTTIDRIDEEIVASLTLDDFVGVVAALTERKEIEEINAENSAHCRAWED